MVISAPFLASKSRLDSSRRKSVESVAGMGKSKSKAARITADATSAMVLVWLTLKAMHADQQRQYLSIAALGVACAGFSIFEFLPPQTLPASRECKGMAATLREGTAPKLVQVNASPVAGETIASKTAKAGNTPQGATMGLARPIARTAPHGFQIREKSTGRHSPKKHDHD